MLMYHPAQDVNHCIFRLLLILEHSEHESLQLDVYRLVDFYFLFPHLLKLLEPLPRPVNKYKKDIGQISEPFEAVVNTKRILHELQVLQSAAIQNLLARRLLDIKAFETGLLMRSPEAIDTNLNFALQESQYPNLGWFKALVNELPKVKFIGKNGLKARTGLMEYRYDVE